jgi:hypothetical protein
MNTHVQVRKILNHLQQHSGVSLSMDVAPGSAANGETREGLSRQQLKCSLT